jgi:hypothetical protein
MGLWSVVMTILFDLQGDEENARGMLSQPATNLDRVMEHLHN